MGSLQLCTPVGSIIMHKFLIASCLAVAALAAPEADADAHLAVHTNALVGAGGVAPAWPTTTVLGYGLHQSTCYGCRGHYIGKRSAEADPYYGYGYAPIYGYRYAAPIYGYGLGIAHHGGHATSYVATSPHGLGKRSAEAEAGVHGYGHVVGLGLNNVHGLTSHVGTGYGISQLHPSGHSFQHINRLHKREAEAEPEAYAYYGYGYGHRLGYHGLGYSHGGYYGHGYGHGYGYGYGHGYGYGYHG